MVVFFDGLGDEGGDSMKEEHKDAIEVSIVFHEGQRMFAVPKQVAPVPLTDEHIDAKFEAFASQFDHESNEWLDMGVDAYFRAGFRAAHGITKGQR
jgi:hypothetical protein